MLHRQLPWLAGLLFLSLAAPSFADRMDTNVKTEGRMPDVAEQQATQNEVLAHKMMGHINLARMALDLNLPSEANKQLERAQGLLETLDSQMPQRTLHSSFKYGKVTYDDNSILADNYLPIVDDVFLVSDYQTIFKRAKAADVKETSAGVMRVGISLDLREVQAALDKAATSMQSNDTMTAKTALTDVFKNAIVDEEEVEDPRLLIAENLALAKSFLDQDRYDSARLTLKHVQDRMKRAGKDQYSGVDAATLDRFSADLDQMRADLREKDPTLSQRVSNRLTGWGKTISGWFS